ncbi:MAG: PAS domain S-box protein, partial [Microvirga sp.]
MQELPTQDRPESIDAAGAAVSGASGPGLRDLVHAFDWSRTELGPRQAWPQTLRLTVELVLHSNVSMVLFWGPRGVMIYNDAFAAFAGRRHPELLGTPVPEAWPEFRAFIADALEAVLSGGTVSRRDQRLRLQRAGEPDDAWINLDCSPVVDDGDRVVGGLAILVETSERVRAEEALRQSNERLRIAQRAGMIGTFEWYPASGRLDVSDEYRAVWGLPADVTVTDDLLVSLVSAEDRPLTGPARLDERNPLDYAEYRITRPDNQEQRWIARRGEVMSEDASGDRRFVGVAFDVTERRRAELALKESEERFRAIANSAPVLMWVRGLDGRQEFVNSAYCAFLGLAYPQAVVVDWLDALHPDDRDRIRQDVMRAEPTGLPFALEGRYRRADGQWRWLRSEIQPRFGPAGETLGFIGVASDITDVREAQNALRQYNATLEVQVEQRTRERDLVWKNSNELMAVFGFDGYRKAINPAWSRLLGYDEATLLTLPFDEITHPDDLDSLRASVRDLASGQYIRQFEGRLRCADGSYRLISWTGIPGDGEFYAIGRDITEQRITEEALRQSQKMEAVGQLTGGIAHDFNNLLTGITGSLDLLQRRLAAGRMGDVQRYIDAATASATRAAALTHRLLAFARRQSLDTRPTDVNALVSSIEDLLKRTMGETIAVTATLSPGLWPALTDANQLESALLNLAINSRDAMPEGGALRIGTRNISFDLRDARQLRGMMPGDYVALVVSDSGTGMAANVVERAFEPFFTTKPLGQGTGLGLSMIYGFVKQTKGYIQIDSAPGDGTTVFLYLPRHVGEIEALRDDGHATPQARQGETVLLV